MPQAIFVLGMTTRSGTNFVYDLLTHHPDCVGRERVLEDYLLNGSGHLMRFVDDVTAHWAPSWGAGPRDRELLVRHLGDGLLRFVTEAAATARVVTKTPSVVVRKLGPYLRQYSHGRGLARCARKGLSPSPLSPAPMSAAAAAYRLFVRYPLARWLRDLECVVRGQPRSVAGFLLVSPIVWAGLAASALGA